MLTRSAWMAQLPRQLARDNPNFRSLWEEGYVAEKQVAITQSAAHSYHLSIGNVKKQTIVLTARVVREKGPLTLASGAQIWATNWFLYKKKDSGALFDPHLDYFRYLIVISLIT